MKDSTLQTEIKKKRPFESPAQEALLNLFRTSDRLQIQVDRLLRSFDLTLSQYNVLRILRGEGQPLPCAEVASRMISAVPAMTGLIDRLQGAKLIARERSAEDRRVIRIAITEKARALLAQIDRPINELHKRLLGHLATSELKELSGLLEKARRSNEESVPLSLNV